jgi:UDP-N-acetylglucosamine 4,6-dehydratase
MIYNKVLLFGGTGSLGKNLIKRLTQRVDIGRISVFSRCEEKSVAVRQLYPDVISYIGDIRDMSSVGRCIAFEKPDIIINCAALKNVPECEIYPLEAIKTNILGSQNIISCVESLCKKIKVLAISTDKAAKPTSSYGMTKALQERLWVRGCGSSIFNLVNFSNDPKLN